MQKEWKKRRGVEKKKVNVKRVVEGMNENENELATWKMSSLLYYSCFKHITSGVVMASRS